MAVLRRNVKPNDFHSYKVTLGKEDVSDLVSSIEVYQDIFSPTWSANLYIVDAMNIQTEKNIAVGVPVKIELETNTPLPVEGIQQKIYHFILHSISDKTLIKKDVYGYNLKLTTSTQLGDFKKRVSKSFKNKKPNDMVSTIVKEHLNGSIETSVADEKYDIIIPNLSPISAINYISNFSKSSGKEADWVFFQSDESKYKFKSLEDMYNDDTGWKLIHGEINYRDNSTKENKDSFIKIQKYSFVNQIDGLRNMATGFFGSSTITHDIINKKIINKSYQYSDYNSLDKQNKPYKGKEFDNSEKSVITYMTKHDGMTSASKSFHENNDKWVGSRRSSMMKLDTNRLMVKIAGGAIWWQSIGRVITVDLPSQEGKNPDDKYYTGKYVVMAIRHTIQGNNYTIVMELGKKRLNKQLE